jgi:hypothetical protein
MHDTPTPTRSLRRWSALAGAVLSAASLLTVAPGAVANTPLTADPNDLSNFVAASIPQWYFARANGHDACWPAPAFVNGAQHAPAPLKAWPDSDTGCPQRGTPFPTYTGVRTCFGTEVRVAFTLYWPKDGFWNAGVKNGHAHDFEYVVVGWRYYGNNQWVRSQLWLSTHGKHRVERNWNKVQTLTRLPGENTAGKGGDYPRVFVGYGKHAMFNNQGGVADIASTTNANEYRHADYPGFLRTSFVPVTNWNAIGAKFEQYNWGDASSNPTAVYRKLCDI